MASISRMLLKNTPPAEDILVPQDASTQTDFDRESFQKVKIYLDDNSFPPGADIPGSFVHSNNPKSGDYVVIMSVGWEMLEAELAITPVYLPDRSFKFEAHQTRILDEGSYELCYVEAGNVLGFKEFTIFQNRYRGRNLVQNNRLDLGYLCDELMDDYRRLWMTCS